MAKSPLKSLESFRQKDSSSNTTFISPRTFSQLTFKMWFKEIPINGRRMSPAALVAIVMFFCTISKELMSIDNAVWFDTGSSKMSASSVNCGRIFCVSVCSSALVWFRTDDTRLSTFLPAVSTSRSPLCRSSFPYSPATRKTAENLNIFILLSSRLENQSSKLNQIWFDGEGERERVREMRKKKTHGDDCEHDSWSCGVDLWCLCVQRKRKKKRQTREKMPFAGNSDEESQFLWNFWTYRDRLRHNKEPSRLTGLLSSSWWSALGEAYDRNISTSNKEADRRAKWWGRPPE